MQKQINAITKLVIVSSLTTALFSATQGVSIISQANAQSFQCARAQIPAELAICNNEDLLILDEQMAGLFADLRVNASTQNEIEAISDNQKEWLRKRNECEINFTCLRKVYKKRIRSLEKETSL